jgi:hypothetical protein
LFLRHAPTKVTADLPLLLNLLVVGVNVGGVDVAAVVYVVVGCHLIAVVILVGVVHDILGLLVVLDIHQVFQVDDSEIGGTRGGFGSHWGVRVWRDFFVLGLFFGVGEVVLVP